jgi:phosphoglycolate phosphatase-like HAD superfamily hydrolase
MLGDTPYDVQAARSSAVRVLALRCGGWDDAHLHGAWAVFDDPSALLENWAATRRRLDAQG